MDNIFISLPDGKVLDVPRGTTALDVAKTISPRLESAALVARVTYGEVYFAPGIYDRLKSDPAALRAVIAAGEMQPGVAKILTAEEVAGRPATQDPIKSAEAATNDATAQRNALAAQVDTERRSRLEGDERGQRLLSGLDAANFAAAATAVIGPGLTITIEPGTRHRLVGGGVRTIVFGVPAFDPSDEFFD